MAFIMAGMICVIVFLTILCVALWTELQELNDILEEDE